jgi:hypothetical protein
LVIEDDSSLFNDFVLSLDGIHSITSNFDWKLQVPDFFASLSFKSAMSNALSEEKLKILNLNLSLNVKPLINGKNLNLIQIGTIIIILYLFCSLREKLNEASQNNIKSSHQKQNELDSFVHYQNRLNDLCIEIISEIIQPKHFEVDLYVKMKDWQWEIFNQFFFNSILLKPSLTKEEREQLSSQLSIHQVRLSDLYKTRVKQFKKYFT